MSKFIFSSFTPSDAEMLPKTAGKVPQVGALKKQLQYGENRKSTGFYEDVSRFQKKYVTTPDKISGRSFTDWKSPAHQRGLTSMVDAYLDRDGKGKVFWPDDPNDALFNELRYTVDHQQYRDRKRSLPDAAPTSEKDGPQGGRSADDPISLESGEGRSGRETNTKQRFVQPNVTNSGLVKHNLANTTSRNLLGERGHTSVIVKQDSVDPTLQPVSSDISPGRKRSILIPRPLTPTPDPENQVQQSPPQSSQPTPVITQTPTSPAPSPTAAPTPAPAPASTPTSTSASATTTSKSAKTAKRYKGIKPSDSELYSGAWRSGRVKRPRHHSCMATEEEIEYATREPPPRAPSPPPVSGIPIIESVERDPEDLPACEQPIADQTKEPATTTTTTTETTEPTETASQGQEAPVTTADLSPEKAVPMATELEALISSASGIFDPPRGADSNINPAPQPDMSPIFAFDNAAAAAAAPAPAPAPATPAAYSPEMADSVPRQPRIKFRVIKAHRHAPWRCPGSFLDKDLQTLRAELPRYLSPSHALLFTLKRYTLPLDMEDMIMEGDGESFEDMKSRYGEVIDRDFRAQPAGTFEIWIRAVAEEEMGEGVDDGEGGGPRASIHF